MVMSTLAAVEYKVSLTKEERAELLCIFEATLIETHAERRRTEAPDYQEEVSHEETLIKALVDKVRRSHS